MNEPMIFYDTVVIRKTVFGFIPYKLTFSAHEQQRWHDELVKVGVPAFMAPIFILWALERIQKL